MNTEGMSKHDILDLAKDAPVILIGEGKSLRGDLRLRNPGTDRIQLREASLRLQIAPAKKPAPFAQVPLPASLLPGQAHRVKVALELDPQMPPGEYKGELEAAGYTRKVIMFVAEVVRLVISPPALVIDQPAGSKVVKQLMLTNDGNVPVTIGSIGQVPLGEELMLHRSVSTTVASTGEKGLRAISKLFVDLVSEEAKIVMGEAGYLTVTNKGLVLQPGEMGLLSLEIQLPEKLASNARYIARVPLYTSVLEFVVVPLPGKPTT
jgi:hypothetical protein